MSQTSRHEYLKMIQYHYHRASGRAAKAALLDQGVSTLGVGRKYLLRLLNAPTDSRPPKPRTGRPRTYGPAVLGVIKRLWLVMDQPCGKLLQAGLSLWLPSLEAQQSPLDPALRRLVLKISSAQIDRLLAPVKTSYPAKTRPASINEVRRQIPVRQGPWETTGPGWFEADTVFHSGGDPGGSFVRSLCLTDIYSGWTEVRATWNQSHLKVHERLREIEAGLPFPLRGYDSDNGSEMINEAVLAYLRQPREHPVEITRSRPYHKNDNAHVEQKNRTHIRDFIGHDRIDSLSLVPLLNDTYLSWSLLRNLYYPSSKLLSKERRGSKLIKRHERRPQTAAQRLLEHPATTQETRDHIQRLLGQSDPLSLRALVEQKLKIFLLAQTRHQEGTLAAKCVSGEAGSGGGGACPLRSQPPPPPASASPPTHLVPPPTLRTKAKRPA